MSNKRPDMSSILPIARAVTLQSVSCREISARRTIKQRAIPAEVHCMMSHEATGMRDFETNEIHVLLRFSFQAAAEKTQPAERIAEISATLSLRYALPEEELKRFSPEEVQVFAESNGVYNAWPYWRELLQSASARLGLPAVIAPVFRLVNSQGRSEEKKPS